MFLAAHVFLWSIILRFLLYTFGDTIDKHLISPYSQQKTSAQFSQSEYDKIPLAE